MKYCCPKDYVDGILKHSRIALSKAITMIESSLPSHQETAQEILSLIMPYTGNSVRIGITGVPGAGKSTFIESFGMYLVESHHKVAVLAIDPSSSISGGSILADKTRMEKLSAHHNAFIRPSPSSGCLGGVARKTRESMLLCEAAGFDTVLVETVGVGQSETAVSSMVDFFLVLMLPNAGDELQGIKKGVLELADAIVVNKADGSQMEKAILSKKIYENAIHILTPASQDWTVPVLTCSSIENTGITEIWDTVLRHNKILKDNGELVKKRRKQAVSWMWSMFENKIKDYIFSIPKFEAEIALMQNKVESGTISSTQAAENIFKCLLNF